MADDMQPPIPVVEPKQRFQALVDKANVVANDSIPIRRYWTSSREILRMAKIHMDEQNYEKCFILYMKYVILFFEQLPKHCEYPQADQKEKDRVKNYCQKVAKLAEDVKAIILKSYEQEYKAYLYALKKYEDQVKERESRLKYSEEKGQKDFFVENLQLELDRKKQQLANQAKTKQSQITTHTDENTNAIISDEDKSLSDDSPSEYQPSAPLSSESEQQVLASGQLVPTIDRSTKPTYDIGKVDLLSTLVLPFRSVIDKFTKLAQSNTSRNVETCAILAGKLSQDRFTITHLLVPKQSGTSETCSASNEEELAIEQEKLQLITVGWIHTHPSQRSFLSSVDLHTHAPYQKILPEAVAIVVAPNANEIGTYSLTENGLDYILRCRQKGFHPHPNEQSLYGEAKHVQKNDQLEVQVIDFR